MKRGRFPQRIKRGSCVVTSYEALQEMMALRRE